MELLLPAWLMIFPNSKPSQWGSESEEAAKFEFLASRKKEAASASSEIGATVFGNLITADHIVLGSETDFSRHGDTAALVCQDFGTNWIAG